MTEGRVTESSSRICQLLMIHMTGGAPYGFRIASVHSDGISPFAVSTIRINGKAYRAGLQEADLVLAINGFSCCSGLSHHSATRLMEYDDPELTLHILRGENLCEDDIKKSLQSLDSQIVELTDNEVQSTIAKKQLQQPVGIPAWKNKLTNSLSHLNVSPSWLQPPPNTRPKMVERRNDMQSLSQPIEHTLTDSAGLTDDQVHETWTKVKTKANNDMATSLTMAQLNMSETTNEGSKDFQLNDKPMSELKNHNSDCSSSQKYQLNDAKQQIGQWNELPSNVSMDKANDKFISQSKPTTGHFDMASSTNISDRSINNLVEEAGQNVLLKQQQNNSHFRNRYRVEQTILFKPLDQARIYDAESGQFRENSSEKLPKRRSNSISCYHMYIGSGIPKPSSVVVSNREQFHQTDECSRWKPSEGNRKQFDGTVYQWANGAIKNPVTDLNEGVSRSSSTSMQPPPASSPNVSDIYMPSSVKQLSQQLYPAETLSHNIRTSHWSSNRTIQSTTTPTEQLQASPNRWETRRLQQSPPVRSFSPAVDNVLLHGSNSSHCMPMSTAKLVPATMGTVFYETPSKSIHGTSKALPTMISLRSNEDEASSPVCTHFSQVNETAQAKARPSKHYSDMKSLNFDAKLHGSSTSRITSSLGFDTNQQLTQSENYHSAHKPNRSINQIWPVNANSNSLNTLLVNEGKGGRLFARRRANSDAWIVGERDEANKAGAKSTIIDSNQIAGMHAMTKPFPDVMQRRQSLTAGHLQQPVHSEIGNNSHQYRSRTAQKVMNSLSSRPFDEMQYMNYRPNCHSQSSAGQRGINESVQLHQLDLNSWQQRATTDHPVSPSISQRLFRSPHADQHPIYLHAAEANRHRVQSNTGYTDL